MQIGFKSVHPVTSLIFFIFAFMLAFVSSNPMTLLLCVVCGAIYSVKLEKSKAVSFILKFIIPIILLITAFNFIFSHYGETVLFTSKSGSTFTLEAIVYGVVSAVRISAVLFWLNCFNEIISNDKIIFLFGRFSPRLALIISMVLRFIPRIREQSDDIIKAEKGIGNGGQAIGFTGRVKSASRRLSILVSWTLERSIDTSDSMRARGYGLSGRTSANNYVFSLSDVFIILLSVTGTALIFIFSKKLASSYSPTIEIPNVNAVIIAVSVFFASVLMTPVIYDFKEEKKWSISK